MAATKNLAIVAKSPVVLIWLEAFGFDLCAPQKARLVDSSSFFLHTKQAVIFAALYHFASLVWRLLCKNAMISPRCIRGTKMPEIKLPLLVSHLFLSQEKSAIQFPGQFCEQKLELKFCLVFSWEFFGTQFARRAVNISHLFDVFVPQIGKSTQWSTAPGTSSRGPRPRWGWWRTQTWTATAATSAA